MLVNVWQGQVHDSIDGRTLVPLITVIREDVHNGYFAFLVFHISSRRILACYQGALPMVGARGRTPRCGG